MKTKILIWVKEQSQLTYYAQAIGFVWQASESVSSLATELVDYKLVQK